MVILIGQVELVRRGVGLEGLVVLTQRRAHLAELVLKGVLLAALALAALADQHFEERLGAFPVLLADVLVDQRKRRFLVLGIGLVAGLPGEDGAGVVAQHLLAQLAELHEQARALAWGLGVALLLVQVARRLVVVCAVDGDLPERRQRRQVRGVEIQRHLVALLRRHAIVELLVERLADAVEGVDALLGVLRQLGDARHVVDGLRRVAQLVVELRQRLERRDVLLVEVDDVLVRVDGALGVLHLVGVDLGNRAVELDLRLALERRGDVPIVGVDEVEPLPQLAVVALELEVRLLVVGVDLEHLLEPLRGEVGLEEVLLVQASRGA